MQQKSMLEAVQIEMLADAKNLGQFEGVYRQNLFLVYLLGCSLLFFAGGLAGVHDMLSAHTTVASTTGDTPLWERIIFIIISIISLFISFVFIYEVFSMRTDKILLYEHGLIIKRSQQLQAICWNEVQCVRSCFIYHSHDAWDYYYQLQMKNGRTIDFRNGRLFSCIERKLKYRRL